MNQIRKLIKYDLEDEDRAVEMSIVLRYQLLLQERIKKSTPAGDEDEFCFLFLFYFLFYFILF